MSLIETGREKMLAAILTIGVAYYAYSSIAQAIESRERDLVAVCLAQGSLNMGYADFEGIENAADWVRYFDRATIWAYEEPTPKHEMTSKEGIQAYLKDASDPNLKQERWEAHLKEIIRSRCVNVFDKRERKERLYQDTVGVLAEWMEREMGISSHAKKSDE